MANAVATTSSSQVKSNHRYELHVLRRAYIAFLEKIDKAVFAERELEFATSGQPGGIFDPSLSGYLRNAEAAWDAVNDSLSAIIIAASSVPEGYPLASIVFAWREILTSENQEDFLHGIGQAHHQITKTILTNGMSVVMKDAHQVLRATAGRLDELSKLNIFGNAQSPVCLSH
ncbi:hypothetical protein [uncultured Pelagimonas sp.]|uniref:hypothetical protein n=1 Tax=uncultured Pelagimonas sp. TaxID=1618102 RepID=UPI00260B42BA|nr:hypothetical protein [uncultured Pelagimonas sp.]